MFTLAYKNNEFRQSFIDFLFNSLANKFEDIKINYSVIDEYDGDITTLTKERDLAMKEKKIKEKSCNNLQEQIQELKSQVTVAEDHANCQCQNYEKVLKGLKWYCLAVVILALIVVLQWIF